MFSAQLPQYEVLEKRSPESGLLYEPSVRKKYSEEYTPDRRSFMCSFRLRHFYQDECGEWVTALCPYGEDGCPDNEGDYDIIMPEPMSGISTSGYKVRVVDVDDEEDGDCSDEFMLIASDEVATVGEVDGPYLEVTSPADGDQAEAGEEYTVEVRYDFFLA